MAKGENHVLLDKGHINQKITHIDKGFLSSIRENKIKVSSSFTQQMC